MYEFILNSSGPDFRKGGGMYEDKTETLKRIKKTITGILPENVRNRLVLENDEVFYLYFMTGSMLTAAAML